MNTLDFIHNLNSDDVSAVVTSFFDELMVLYNLVGNRQDLDICTTSESVATFIILMESDKGAKDLFNELNGRSFSVYGQMFYIDMILSGSSVTTVINRATP